MTEPDPERTPGLEPGGGVSPGDTPPDAGSESQAAHQEEYPPPKTLPVGWLVAIAVVALVVVGMFVAMMVSRLGS